MHKYLRTFLLCLLSALLAVVLLRVYERHVEQETTGATAQLASYQQPIIGLPTGRTVDPARLYPNFINAAARITPAVVRVRSTPDNRLRKLWQSSPPPVARHGSGVLLSADGLILTNNHVASKSGTLRVELSDGRDYAAQLLGNDPATDLALLKIDETSLPHTSFGNSDSLLVGEWVLAVGHPFNLQSTVTAGIVSAKGRSINVLTNQHAIESFIQTDAAVNAGNSGGALVNVRGELMGINTAIVTESGRYEGYSFAVPSNLAERVVSDLMSYGHVRRVQLGAQLYDLNPSAAEKLGLSGTDGVRIGEVQADGNAAAAGLQTDDVVVGAAARRVRKVPDLLEVIGRAKPNDRIALDYWRDGKLQRRTVLLRSPDQSATELPKVGRHLLQELGCSAQHLAPNSPRPGVRLNNIQPNSKLDAAGLEENFIVTRVNRQPVSTSTEFIKAVQRVQAGKEVLLEGYYANFSGEYYYTFMW